MFPEGDDFFSRINIIHKLCGIFPPKKDGGKIKSYGYILIAGLCHLYSVFFVVCEIMVVDRMLRNLKLLFRFLALTLSHFLGMAKTFLIITQRKRIQTIQRELQDERYTPSPVGDYRPDNIFQASKTFASKFVVTVFLVYNMVPTSGFISSLVNLSLKQTEEYFEGNVTCFDYLPYFHVIPFETPTKFTCQMALINMYCALLVLCNYTTVYDILFTSITMCIKSKLTVLCGAAETIRERTLLKLNLPLDYEVFKDEDDPKLENALYKEQIDCVNYLNFLLGTCQEVESLFTYITLGQLVISLIVLASSLYNFTVVPLNDPEVFSILSLLSAVMLQLSMICYFGNGISTQSSLFSCCLYKGKWLNSSKRFKQGMVTTMTRMQNNVNLTIGKFSPLTLATLLTVVKGSFSYVAVFKTMEN